MHLHMPLLALSVHYLYNALRNIIIIIILLYLLVITHVTQLVHGYSYGLPFSTHHTIPFLYGKMYIVGSYFNFVFLSPRLSKPTMLFADMTMQIAPAH